MQLNSKIILIVDDDTELSMLIGDMLEDNGYIPEFATSIEEAYEKIAERMPQLILLDINLPDGTGFGLCRELRKSTQVPIIFASARTSEEDKVDGLDMGADDYLAKPYSIRELLSRINSLFRRSYGSNTGEKIELKAGENNTICLDTAGKKVYRNGREVELSPKEYELLVFMVKNKGIALEKEKIINEIWGVFSEVEQSTLTVHIRWLREKLEITPSKPLMIKTVWGTGYILEEA